MGPVTVVWLAEGPRDAPQERALKSWSLAHGAALAPPRDERPRSLLAEPRVADDVEAFLERARDAVSARDGEAADASLSAAEALLRANPQLPQAAWQMAEVERTRSVRWRKIAPADPEAAQLAWTRADALDGGRAAGLGEESFGPSPREEAELSVRGLPDGGLAWLDGAALAGGAVQGITVGTLAGPHTLVVTVSGVPVWARWLDVGSGRSALTITAPGVVPCSSSDVARASLARGVVAGDRVRCEDWIAVLPGGPSGAIRVARCSRGECGPLNEWSQSPAPSPDGLWAPPREREGQAAPAWPPWFPWAMAGAGAAIAAGVVFVATGALQPQSTEVRFVSGGIRTP